MKKLSKIALSVSLLGLGVNVVAPLVSNQVQVAFAEDDSQYKAIFDEYVAKLNPEAERLAKEYVDEVATNKFNDAEKTDLAVNKLVELANIPAEGILKMSELNVATHGGELSPSFTKWSNELTNYYAKESQPIFDRFVESYAYDGTLLSDNVSTPEKSLTDKDDSKTETPKVETSKTETSTLPAQTTVSQDNTKLVMKATDKTLPKTSAVK